MSFLTKIQQGTMRGDTDLCVTCRNALITKTTEGVESRLCRANFYSPIQMKTRVAECNNYSNRREITIEAFQQIAWDLTPPSSKGKLGFVTPEDRKKSGLNPPPLQPGIY